MYTSSINNNNTCNTIRKVKYFKNAQTKNCKKTIFFHKKVILLQF